MLEEEKIKQEAWVVFCGETDVPWLKLLKKGYRHCFVLINDGERWLSLDPLSSYMEVQVYHHILPSFDLPNWLENRGYQILKTDIDRSNTQAAPIMFFSCVEAIKRLLGIHKRFIFTPWQLYQFLNKAQNRSREKQAPQQHSNTNHFNKNNMKEISYG